MVVQSTLASVLLVAFGTVRKAWPAFIRCGARVRVSDVARLVSRQTKAGVLTQRGLDTVLPDQPKTLCYTTNGGRCVNTASWNGVLP
jgi:hypothetical protein